MRFVFKDFNYLDDLKKFICLITNLRSHPIQGGGSGIVRRIAEHMGRAFLAGASPPRGCVASQRAAQFSRHLRAQRLLLLIRLLLLLLRLLLRLLLYGLRDSLQRIRTDWYRYWSSLHKIIKNEVHLTNIRWDNFVDNFQFFPWLNYRKTREVLFKIWNKIFIAF